MIILQIQKVIVAVMKNLYPVTLSNEMLLTCWTLKLKRNHKMMMMVVKRNEESEQFIIYYINTKYLYNINTLCQSSY